MKTKQLTETLKRLNPSLGPNGEVFGKFYCKDGQAVLLPVEIARPATPAEKTRAGIPVERNITLIVAEGDS